MNVRDYIILAVILIAVAAAIIYVVRTKNTCGKSCGDCPYAKNCKR